MQLASGTLQIGGIGGMTPRRDCPATEANFPVNLMFDNEVFPMKAIHIFSVSAIVTTLILGGCSTMTPQQKDTAIGAAVGGVAGSVLTGGSTAGTIGGAAVGGVVGHETSKDKK